ncbi:MAG: hypothetical protein KJ607_03250, partial [Bacteroidetes bacterium]|nr:hypothetical protein [Bacteroidota bacterium]
NKVGVGTGTPQNKLSVKGDASSGINEAIFSVVSPAGDTLFAVYPQGTRVYVEDEQAKATGNRAGFAVGGFSLSKGTTTNEYLRVTPDSVRIFVTDDPGAKASGNRGGFAVGGFSLSKGLTNEYLRVTPDSVRIYIEDTIALKASGNRGGFAVGGFSLSKGANDSLFLFSDKTGFNVTYLSQAERDGIANPRISSIIFNTTDSCLQIFLGYWESIWCTPMGCAIPAILIQPVNDTCDTGESVSFTVSAVGSKIYYKWQESTDGGLTWKMLSDGGTNPQYNGTHTDSIVISNVPGGCNLYMYRCYISNACGNEISSPVTLAMCGFSFTDSRDSRTYNTLQIGNQCWMAENLDIGTMISSTGGGQLQTDNGVIEKYCHSNNSANCDIYGGLYEWNELMQYNPSDAGNPGTTQGICPAGWHLPTSAELTEITDFVGGTSIAGGKLKETGTTHWVTPNTGATNESGFTALPGGNRKYDTGTFQSLGTNGIFWSATEGSSSVSKRLVLSYTSASLYQNNDDKASGFSVRCVKNK